MGYLTPPQRLRGGRFLHFALFGTRSFTRFHLEVLPNSLVHTVRRVAGEVEVGRSRDGEKGSGAPRGLLLEDLQQEEGLALAIASDWCKQSENTVTRGIFGDLGRAIV